MHISYHTTKYGRSPIMPPEQKLQRLTLWQLIVMLEIGELVSNLRHRARDASRVLPSAPLDRPSNNNITELLPLDRDIPTCYGPGLSPDPMILVTLCNSYDPQHVSFLMHPRYLTSHEHASFAWFLHWRTGIIAVLFATRGYRYHNIQIASPLFAWRSIGTDFRTASDSHAMPYCLQPALLQSQTRFSEDHSDGVGFVIFTFSR